MLERMLDMVQRFPKLFLDGAGMTIYISLLCVLFGVVLGTFFAMLRLSQKKVLRGIAITYIEIIRGTPILLQLYIFVFGLPSIGIKLPEFYGVLLAMALNSGAYVAEIIRGGINAVDSGQMEAARSLGMSRGAAMSKIILPQAIKNILPSLGNEFVMLVKESSLASIFFIGDIMTVQKSIQGATYLVMESLLVCGVIYFCLTFTLSRVMGVLERRMRQSD